MNEYESKLKSVGKERVVVSMAPEKSMALWITEKWLNKQI